MPLPEPRAPDLGVPPGEGGGEIGEWFLGAGAQGVGGGGQEGDGGRGVDGRGEGGEFEEAGEEEDEEGGGGEHRGEVVDGLYGEHRERGEKERRKKRDGRLFFLPPRRREESSKVHIPFLRRKGRRDQIMDVLDLGIWFNAGSR